MTSSCARYVPRKAIAACRASGNRAAPEPATAGRAPLELAGALAGPLGEGPVAGGLAAGDTPPLGGAEALD